MWISTVTFIQSFDFNVEIVFKMFTRLKAMDQSPQQQFKCLAYDYFVSILTYL